jgi:diketogulonate reductase-like aldo/keto reductase
MPQPSSPSITGPATVPRRHVQGVTVPAFMYGTAWKEERSAELTTQALELGLRAIDTANQRRHYFEQGVGEAVTAFTLSGKVERAELFLQTKFTHVDGQDHRLPYDPDAPIAIQVEQSLKSSLKHLRCTYLDAYLLHGPSQARGLAKADWEVWRAMEHHQQARTIRLLGVSNVTAEQLRTLMRDCAVLPAFVQNRCYARTNWDAAVRTLCLERGVVYQGFSLLTANRRELASPVVSRIANDIGCTWAQLVFRFATQIGILPLTGSSSAEHLREDLACFAFELSPAQVRALERIAE